MFGLSNGQRDLLALTTALKILLFPAYRSTDFEVHRNWLAITHNLPWREWYYEKTSEWTLDYPPFFAYFSYFLALPARLLPTQYSTRLLSISSTPVEGWDVTVYMRLTVLITELVLLVSLLRLSRSSSDSSFGVGKNFIAMTVFLHPGFLILDNLHFQYNAFLFGIMVWSLVGAKEGKPGMCAIFFAGLLMFKHIFIYLAPAWFVYLLRGYCFKRESNFVILFRPLVKIGVNTLSIFALGLGPFIITGQGPQLLSRLFPFTRGLMHAYWAPNAWAGVALLDRILLQVAKRLDMNLSMSSAGIASTSRGLVGDTHFAILPNVSPLHCFILTGITQMMQLIPLWRNPTYTNFLKAIAACGFSSFMFGWHVHEKAIMLVLVPLSLLAQEDWNLYQGFEIANVSGIISLFPLLFDAQENPIKIGYSLIWAIVVFRKLRSTISEPSPTLISKTITYLQMTYVISMIPLLFFTSTLYPLLILSGRISASMEFLPLMLTSVWASVGVWVAWARLEWSLWSSHKLPVKKN